MARIQKMQAKGLGEMRFDDSPDDPLPEDYAHDSLEISAQTLPFVRNTYAHSTAMLHPTVLDTLKL
jgi:hypothetical protein